MEKKLNFTSESLLNFKFDPKEKGYDSLQVDQVFDKIIEDYETLKKELQTVTSEKDKHSQEIEKLKSKIEDYELELGKLKQQVAEFSKIKEFSCDNYALLKKVSAYERVLYKKGIDLKKALSDPDNC